MEKMPIELFIDQQLKQPRYQEIIAQLGVDADLVKLVLVTYLRDQGVLLVSPTLGSELGKRLATELASDQGIARKVKSLQALPKKQKSL